jgi:hypothetical protein
VKRILLGTVLCLLILIALLALASRWPALFWLLVISVSLYLLIGRKVEVEFRLGIRGVEEKRIYGALVWKRRTDVTESSEKHESARLQVAAAGRDR